MDFSIQPVLENEKAVLIPLKTEDFERLYAAASDPLVWAQHPNKNRYQREVFEVFFAGAIQSKGAFLIKDLESGDVAGCTRFYDYNPEKNLIYIGYTFYARKYWGTGMNIAVKKTMLDYIFQFVDVVHFHIGANNIRSQLAIAKLGAVKVGEIEVAYFGEQSAINFDYKIDKDHWNFLGL